MEQTEVQATRYRLTGEAIQQIIQYMASEECRDIFRARYTGLMAESVDNIAVSLQNALGDIMKKFGTVRNLPRSERNSFPRNPWFDAECKNYVRDMGKQLWQGEQLKEAYVHAKKQYTNLVRRKKRLYQRLEVEKLRHMRKHDVKAFWRQVKPRSGHHSQHCSKITRNEWLEHFKKVVGQETATEVTSDAATHDDDCQAITIEEIRQAVHVMKSGKAVGLDGIPAELLKCGNEEMFKCLQLLFNKVLEHGRFPTAWKTAVIIPIPKTRSDLDKV